MLNDPSSCLRLKTGSGKDVGQQSEFKDRVNVENSGGLLTHELFDNLKKQTSTRMSTSLLLNLKDFKHFFFDYLSPVCSIII